MKTIVVWLLITVSNGAHNVGSITVVGKFPDSKSCYSVASSIPHQSSFFSWNCIKTEIVVNE